MKEKYRIKRHVMFDPEHGDTEPSVYYTIEWKCFLLWVKLDKVLGSKTYVFDTADEAEKALKKHDQIQKLLWKDDEIVKVLKL